MGLPNREKATPGKSLPSRDEGLSQSRVHGAYPSSSLPQLIYSSISPAVQLRQSLIEQVGGAAHPGEDLMTLPYPTVNKHIRNEHSQASTDRHLKMAVAWLSG